jgi:hypothetical protein
MRGERRLITRKTHLKKSEFKLERGRTDTLRIQIEGDFGRHSVKSDEVLQMRRVGFQTGCGR